jgi:hypothetical protein
MKAAKLHLEAHVAHKNRAKDVFHTTEKQRKDANAASEAANRASATAGSL